MADFSILGHLEGIRYTDSNVIVTMTERRLGYKKKDGTQVESELITWRIMYRASFRKFIADHFSKGMLVKVKGIILPYAKTHEGEFVDGYTILGQTIDIAAYPSNTMRQEKQRIKDSQLHDVGTPSFKQYNEPDF